MISLLGEGILLQFYGGKCKNQSQVHNLVICGHPWSRTEYHTCRRFLVSLFKVSFLGIL
uniref:Uncharacterized protein n=1 Tax=Propithecus coquereli TaxID=379532 RepID=A0A2K6F306_PROCO